MDTNGVKQTPLQTGSSKAVVLLFIANDCPISNSYAPEITHLQSIYARKGIIFYLVNTDKGVSAAAVAAHGRAFHENCPTLLDSARVLTRFAGATVTPEAVIYGRGGQRIYRGRIDNRYLDFGKVRPAATTHDLRAALEAIVAHEPLAVPETKAIGCYL